MSTAGACPGLRLLLRNATLAPPTSLHNSKNSNNLKQLESHWDSGLRTTPTVEASTPHAD
jgi:hypothetical protein